MKMTTEVGKLDLIKSMRIGNTPIAYLESLSVKYQNEIYVKLEYWNPTGSIKDRSVLAMVVDALNDKNKDNPHFVIPSSGNAGISLAYICKKIGATCTIYVSDKIGDLKLQYMRSLGATLIICDSDVLSTSPGGWVYEAQEFNRRNPETILLDQFNNEANVQVHDEVTAQEIRDHFLQNGKKIDYLFVGVGSGGTAMGLAKHMNRNEPSITTVIVEPVGGILQGNFYGVSTEYIDHNIESLSDSFVPANLNLSYFHEVYQNRDTHFKERCTELMIEEGLFVGEATGFLLDGIVNYVTAHNIKHKTIVFIATDNGYRYLNETENATF